MEMFEKVERLRQSADVSFAEAKEALDASNGDLLDAMLYLEGKGKVKSPDQSMHSTSYDQQAEYIPVTEKTISKKKEDGETTGQKIKAILKKIWVFLISNYFIVKKNGEKIVTLPLLVAAVALIVCWWFSIILLIVLLFFGFRYEISGKNKMDSVNDVMDSAGDLADKVKEDIRNKKQTL